MCLIGFCIINQYSNKLQGHLQKQKGEVYNLVYMNSIDIL